MDISDADLLLTPQEDRRPEKAALFDATREGIKEGIKHEEEFDNLVEKSDKVLARLKAVFPFDFFPNELTVDVNKVNIITNYFLSRTIHSVYIKDISDISIHNDIFFASLYIIDWGFNKNRSICMHYLKKAEAAQAHRIIQGLIVGIKQNIDLSRIDVPDFRSKVEILGEAKGAEN